MPKFIAVCALKGGVGKSTVTAGLGLALQRQGFKVGFIDIDITGSNLYSALGLEHSPKWQLNSREQKVVVPEINGFWLLSVASYAGESNAVMWEANQYNDLEKIRAELSRITADTAPSEISGIIQQAARSLGVMVSSGKWNYVKEILSKDIVTWPEDLDYIIADMPPSSSAEMFSFFETLRDRLFGVILVSQPAQLSTIGLVRTIDLLKERGIPIIGLVANQDGFRTAEGRIEYQFLSPRTDLQKICSKTGVPMLISIPQSANPEALKKYFDSLAESARYAKPKTIKRLSTGQRIKQIGTKKSLELFVKLTAPKNK